MREVVEEGVAELAAIAREFEEINARFAEPMEPDEMDALLARQAEVQERMDAGGVWDLESRLEMAMDALRCPPGDMPVNKVSGGERRRVALCRLRARSPARAYQPPRCGIRGLARTLSFHLSGHGHCRHP